MLVRRDQHALKLLQDSGIVPPGSPSRGPIVDRIAHACSDGTPAIEQEQGSDGILISDAHSIM